MDWGVMGPCGISNVDIILLPSIGYFNIVNVIIPNIVIIVVPLILYQQIKLIMSFDPFNYPFPKRTDTMSLSTMNQRDNVPAKRFVRQSSFQRPDIHGSSPAKLVPATMTKTGFNLSTYIEPTSNQSKKINKTSDPMKINDIEGTQSVSKGFKTGRVTDPLCPVYRLPYAGEMTHDKGRQFIRDTLKIDDIVVKRDQYMRQKGLEILNEVIPGSKSKNLAYPLNTISRLKVEDINKEGVFESKRRTNPLVPLYKWRDEDTTTKLNPAYGKISGNESKQKHPTVVNKLGHSNLKTSDIDGAYHNSYYDRNYFMEKRRDIRDYMKTNDIENSQSSTLKKGISTLRTTNPLVPNYKLPGHSEPPK